MTNKIWFRDDYVDDELILSVFDICRYIAAVGRRVKTLDHPIHGISYANNPFKDIPPYTEDAIREAKDLIGKDDYHRLRILPSSVKTHGCMWHHLSAEERDEFRKQLRCCKNILRKKNGPIDIALDVLWDGSDYEPDDFRAALFADPETKPSTSSGTDTNPPGGPWEHEGFCACVVHFFPDTVGNPIVAKEIESDPNKLRKIRTRYCSKFADKPKGERQGKSSEPKWRKMKDITAARTAIKSWRGMKVSCQKPHQSLLDAADSEDKGADDDATGSVT